jgi:hypothetical protein
MILWLVSRRISFTGAGTNALTIASRLNASPLANGPVWRSFESTAGGVLKSIFEVS